MQGSFNPIPFCLNQTVGVLWGVFTICYGIISLVVLVQAQWLGDRSESPGRGHFGIWSHCIYSSSLQADSSLTCSGRLWDLSGSISPAFSACTVFVSGSVFIAMLCVICFTMFFFLHAATVFRLCSWMLAISGSCLLMAVLVFPAGFDAPAVRDICGQRADKYDPGHCALRWTFILAVIGAVDALVLSWLGFQLCRRRDYQLQLLVKPRAAGVDRAGSRSMDLQPVMLVPQNEMCRYSDIPPPSHVHTPSHVHMASHTPLPYATSPFTMYT